VEALRSFFRIAVLLLVPPRTRRRLSFAGSHDDLHRWSLALGIAMVFVGAMVSYVDFVAFAWGMADRVAGLFWEKAQGGQATSRQEVENYLHSGILAWASFLFRPRTWLEAWILFEGIFRSAIALGTRHAIGTWPAYPLALIWDSIIARHRKESRLARFGPELPDRVVRNPRAEGSSSIRIESSRDKGWNPAETFDFNGELFELVSVDDFEEGGRLRVRHVFRSWPKSRIVRRLVPYATRAGKELPPDQNPGGGREAPLGHDGSAPASPRG
jgi:hypothetical protein